MSDRGTSRTYWINMKYMGPIETISSTLTREARQQGWWHSYSDVLSEGTDIWVGLETEAEAIRLYEVQVITGLLQTSEYARAVLRAHYRSEPPEQIERRVKLRMARQQLVIEQNNTPIWAVLDEAVLRRHIGPRRNYAVAISATP